MVRLRRGLEVMGWRRDLNEEDRLDVICFECYELLRFEIPHLAFNKVMSIKYALVTGRKALILSIGDGLNAR